MYLTKSQQLVYDMEKFAGGSISIICGSMLAEGEKTLFELQQAVNEIYRLNDALRIRISENGNEVIQTVNPYEEQEFEVLCFNTKEELDLYAEQFAKIPLDLYGLLCETKIVLLPGRYGVLVKLHHLVGDAWTLSLMGNQFNAFLNEETPIAYSYVEHVQSEEAYLQGKRYTKR